MPGLGSGVPAFWPLAGVPAFAVRVLPALNPSAPSATWRRMVPFLLMASTFALALGVTLPIVRFERLVFFEDTPSLVEIVATLWAEGSMALALAVALFSIVFPLVKLGTIHAAAFGTARVPRWAGALSKWSMMDVVLVALVILAAKTSGLADAAAQVGLWFYAGSAVMGAAAAALVKRRAASTPHLPPDAERQAI